MYKFIGKKNQAYVIKLNYNCPDSEKSGSGPGSCGGAAIKDKVKAETKKIKTYPKNINDYPEGPVVTADDLERLKSGTKKIKTYPKNINDYPEGPVVTADDLERLKSGTKKIKTYPKNINDYPEGPVVTADDLERLKSGTKKPKSEKISETLTRYTSGKQQAYVQTMPGKQGKVTFGNKWEKTFDTIEEANNAANEFAKSGKMPNDVKPRRHPLEVKNTRK